MQTLKVYNRLPRNAYLAIMERAKHHRLAVVGHTPEAVRQLASPRLCRWLGA